MSRFGIVTKKAFGVPAAELKRIARDAKRTVDDRHEFARRLWETGVHEARIIAYLVDDPKRVTEEQMDAWAADFDNWAITEGRAGTCSAARRCLTRNFRSGAGVKRSS